MCIRDPGHECCQINLEKPMKTPWQPVPKGSFDSSFFAAGSASRSRKPVKNDSLNIRFKNGLEVNLRDFKLKRKPRKRRVRGKSKINSKISKTKGQKLLKTIRSRPTRNFRPGQYLGNICRYGGNGVNGIDGFFVPFLSYGLNGTDGTNGITDWQGNWVCNGGHGGDGGAVFRGKKAGDGGNGGCGYFGGDGGRGGDSFYGGNGGNGGNGGCGINAGDGGDGGDAWFGGRGGNGGNGGDTSLGKKRRCKFFFIKNKL